jgi:hypothetical protein
MHRETMGQRALAEILFKQERLLRVKFLQRRYDLAQLGLHMASFVMIGHSRLKDGVASARLCPAIHVLFVQ